MAASAFLQDTLEGLARRLVRQAQATPPRLRPTPPLRPRPHPSPSGSGRRLPCAPHRPPFGPWRSGAVGAPRPRGLSLGVRPLRRLRATPRGERRGLDVPNALPVQCLAAPGGASGRGGRQPGAPGRGRGGGARGLRGPAALPLAAAPWGGVPRSRHGCGRRRRPPSCRARGWGAGGPPPRVPGNRAGPRRAAAGTAPAADSAPGKRPARRGRTQTPLPAAARQDGGAAGCAERAPACRKGRAAPRRGRRLPGPGRMRPRAPRPPGAGRNPGAAGRPGGRAGSTEEPSGPRGLFCSPSTARPRAHVTGGAGSAVPRQGELGGRPGPARRGLAAVGAAEPTLLGAKWVNKLDPNFMVFSQHCLVVETRTMLHFKVQCDDEQHEVFNEVTVMHEGFTKN